MRGATRTRWVASPQMHAIRAHGPSAAAGELRSGVSGRTGIPL
ncbi:hypothetical protein SLNWT_2230 [Streptomyces albus]|uniref:Uncharacterized protein n=1 Tax=Streptomyces albus (strain ATCC 21838 / DSM 41398 / FERM P-419 / JCM 4703 / NBRC 107858) TaxID=1081613 RepID=A0A0B5EV84_STRA4|nr:hypothetical protein SLNWT_2230 [Streptomyces albus]